MEVEVKLHCDACDEPKGPLSPIPGEGGPRHLCPACLHRWLDGEIAALEARCGIKGGENDGNSPTEGAGARNRGATRRD